MDATVEAPESATSGAEPPEAPRWSRWVVWVGTGLALLLVGAAAGLFIGLAGSTNSSTPGAGSVDVGFAQDMSVHHLQAVQMAGWERDHTADPALKQLAFDIESTQNAQVGRMQGWLELWGAAAQPTGKYMTWMAGDHAGHGGTAITAGGLDQMPGMATDAELRELRSLSGTALDVRFLQLMLRHHQGGSSMLQYAAEHAGRTEVRNLAAQMLSSQTAESDYMRTLLAQRGAAPLPS